MKFHSKKIRLSGKPAILLTIAIATANLYAFPDFEEAKSSADAGEADAQAIAATYYALGWQTEKNPEVAIQYAEQSSQSGNPLGKFRLGAMMRNGEGIPKDEPRGLSLQAEAVKIWSQDFDEEDPFSLTALGVALFQGKALPQDKALAAKFYKKAADLDFAPAQYNYAMCAKLGEGIPKDPSLSQKYLQKAAQNGYRLAQEALGMAAGASPSEEQSDAPSIAQTGSLGGTLNLAGAAPDAPASAPAPQAKAGTLSGSFSLGSTPSQPATADNSSKQITVTGLGLTPESAEKQAITDAVKQAVGAYIDANTLVQNEEVVRDRILSVSNGFVKEYKVAAPAKKREDGLYEITIIATVATNQIIQKLKESNLIKGEVAGQNLWAEASTKVMNAQDAVKMLEEKLPEFIKNSVTITPLGKDGKPQVATDSSGKTILKMDPAILTQDPVTGKANLIWIFEIGLDNKYYKNQVVPVLIHCFNAISGEKPIEKIARLNARKKELTGDSITNWALPDKYKKLGLKQIQVTSDNYVFDGLEMKIIQSFSKTMDSCKYLAYSSDAIGCIEFLDNNGNFNGLNYACGPYGSYLLVELLDENNEIISSFRRACWQPFQWSRYHSQNISGPILGENTTLPLILFSETEIPIDLLREIKQVKVSLEVPELKVKLKSTSE
jgi:TPR repeat protein